MEMVLLEVNTTIISTGEDIVNVADISEEDAKEDFMALDASIIIQVSITTENLDKIEIQIKIS